MITKYPKLPLALKLIRCYFNLTAKELAIKFKCSSSHIYHIETGKSYISTKIINKYYTTFEIPIAHILLLANELTNDGENMEVLKKSLDERIIAIYEWSKVLDPTKQIRTFSS